MDHDTMTVTEKLEHHQRQSKWWNTSQQLYKNGEIHEICITEYEINTYTKDQETVHI